VGVACCTAAYALLVMGLLVGGALALRRHSVPSVNQQEQHAVLLQNL